jgi:hypothetical protein
LRPSTVLLPVGEGRGIRDLLAVKDGFLVLAGPDDDERTEQPSSMILFWDGRSTDGRIARARPLAQLDVAQVRRPGCDEGVKPEALTLLAETAREYRVLVLSDGMCDGGRLAFTIRR